jgi:hypothetical protein
MSTAAARPTRRSRLVRHFGRAFRALVGLLWVAIGGIKCHFCMIALTRMKLQWDCERVSLRNVYTTADKRCKAGEALSQIRQY